MKKFTLVINNRVTISLEAVTIAGFIANLASLGMLTGYDELWKWLPSVLGKGGELWGTTIRAKLTIENVTS
ncbi:hypothetical protein HOT62_gp090 [Salmonella phage S126]|uniref:Uncharacterized protein n=1 Tax=Salmonella phage S126 TaxID=2231352 RepID=A0A2Z5HNK2_9CAUD|nr:hypothetical protein HOT62_gp090 [Salmonella phage S126]AXC41460.1 hypothetical protein [Salmonella phage S126]